MRWEPELKSSSFFVLSSVGDGLRVCGHRGRAPLFASLPRRRSPRKARHRRLVLALRGVRLSGIPRPVGGRSPRSPWQGAARFFPPGPVALPLPHLSGSEQRPPCPHFNRSGGEGGTHRFSVFARLAGLGPGRAFPRGCCFPLGPMRRERGPMRSRIGPQARSTGPSLPRPPPRGAAQRAAEHRLNLGPRGDARPQAGF